MKSIMQPRPIRPKRLFSQASHQWKRYLKNSKRMAKMARVEKTRQVLARLERARSPCL